jgi:hypothetical protein
MNSDDKDLRYSAPPIGRRAPHTGSPRRPTKCPPTAGRKAPEQAAPLPHHLGPAVAAAGPAPIRPPNADAPPWNPRSGHGNDGSGRPTTWQCGRRTPPVSRSSGPRRPRPPGPPARGGKAPPPPSLRARGDPATYSGSGAAGLGGGGGGGARVVGERLSPARGRRGARTRSSTWCFPLTCTDTNDNRNSTIFDNPN